MPDLPRQNKEDIETYHPDYLLYDDQWDAIEDCNRGDRAIKDRRETYLPKLSGETSQEYEKRQFRAPFFNATKRTCDALAGMINRKPAAIEEGGINKTHLSDITLSGQDIREYGEDIIKNAVSTARSGTFIDWSETESQPYVSHYKAQDILNWATARINGKVHLVMLVLREIEDYVDDYKIHRRKRIRRYRIKTENTADEDESNDAILPGVYYDTWIECIKDVSSDTTEYEQEQEETLMERRGIPLQQIPFVFHNATTVGHEISNPALYDVAVMNISHYNVVADYMNALHFVGLPTPVVTGFQGKAQDIKIGSESAWLLENSDAKAYYLEFQGAGMEEFRHALTDIEHRMAMLGARMLFDQKKDAESFETHALRASSEGSPLAQIASTCSASMTEVIQWVDWWGSTLESHRDSDASFIYSKDFVGSTIAPNMLAELVKAHATGAISFDVFFHNLQKGELYPEGHDLDMERRAIGNPLELAMQSAQGNVEEESEEE